MKFQTFDIPIILPVFTKAEIAFYIGIFVFNIFLAFIYFHAEIKYQEKIGLNYYLGFDFNIKTIPILLFMFILGPVMTFITLIAFVGKKIRHKKNPPEEVIARFENDI